MCVSQLNFQKVLASGHWVTFHASCLHNKTSSLSCKRGQIALQDNHCIHTLYKITSERELFRGSTAMVLLDLELQPATGLADKRFCTACL